MNEETNKLLAKILSELQDLNRALRAKEGGLPVPPVGLPQPNAAGTNFGSEIANMIEKARMNALSAVGATGATGAKIPMTGPGSAIGSGAGSDVSSFIAHKRSELQKELEEKKKEQADEQVQEAIEITK